MSTLRNSHHTDHTAAPLARLDRVSAGYGPSQVLTEFSLELSPGEQVVIVGPSGVGKSTIVRVLAEQLRPRSGRVSFPHGTPRTALAGQAPLLFDWLTVAENLRLGRRLRPVTAVEPADEALVLFGLTELVSAPSTSLTPDQAARASLVRALADRPELLLADNPFRGLAAEERSRAGQWLRRHLVTEGVTSVIATDSLQDAFALADRVVLLGAHGSVLATLNLNHLNHHSPELISV